MKERWDRSDFRGSPRAWHSRGLRSELFTPDILLRLVLLAYAQVQVADDVHHEGTFRRTRGTMRRQVGAPSSAPFSIAKATKRGWQSCVSRMIRFSRIWIVRSRSQGKRVPEADRIRLTEIEVASIVTRFEAPPKTREDMAALLADRLDDIEELLLADISPSGNSGPGSSGKTFCDGR